MSQVMVTTTIIPPSMTVVCSGTMLITSVGQTTSGQHDVVLLPQLVPKDILRGSFWHQHYAPATASVSDAFSGICQLCHGSSAGKYLFQHQASHRFLMSYVSVCYDLVFHFQGPK